MVMLPNGTKVAVLSGQALKKCGWTYRPVTANLTTLLANSVSVQIQCLLRAMRMFGSVLIPVGSLVYK
jgi:hypothetical protein